MTSIPKLSPRLHIDIKFVIRKNGLGDAVPLGSLIGIPSIYLVAVIGRRVNFRINIIVSLIGFIVLAMSHSIVMMAIGLAIVGIPFGKKIDFSSLYSTIL